MDCLGPHGWGGLEEGDLTAEGVEPLGPEAGLHPDKASPATIKRVLMNQCWYGFPLPTILRSFRHTMDF